MRKAACSLGRSHNKHCLSLGLAQPAALSHTGDRLSLQALALLEPTLNHAAFVGYFYHRVRPPH